MKKFVLQKLIMFCKDSGSFICRNGNEGASNPASHENSVE